MLSALKTKLKAKTPRLYNFLYCIYDVTCLRLITRKFRPGCENQADYRKPSTFFIWIGAIYFTTFGFAFQQFESKLDKAEHESIFLINQLSTKTYKSWLDYVPHVQNRKCPVKPLWYNPFSIIASFQSSNDKLCDSVVKSLQVLLKNWKQHLSGNDLSNAHLKDINFSGAELMKTKFQEAKLQKADFRKANLTHADMSKAKLQGAKFQTAELSYANMSGANLQGAIFKETNLISADMSDADLKETNLSGANLGFVNLTRAQGLTYEQLLQAQNLYGVKGLPSILSNKLDKILSSANFAKSITLRGTDLKSLNFREADFRSADLQKTTFDSADLQKSKLCWANLQEASLKHTKLQLANLTGAELKKADLRWANLQEARFIAANLQKATLQWTNSKKVNFGAAKLEKSTLRWADLQEANFTNVKLQETNLQGANLQGATFRGAQGVTFEQLSQVKTLYDVKGLDPDLEKKLKQARPELFLPLQKQHSIGNNSAKPKTPECKSFS